MKRSKQTTIRVRSVGLSIALALLFQLQTTNAIAKPPALKSGSVDTTKSMIYVFVGATGLGHEHGVEGKLISGTVQLGAGEKAGELVFDMKSFVAETPAARKYVGLEGETNASTAKQVTNGMLSADVLNANKFPQATYVIDSALPAKEVGKYVLDGKFTLRAATQPLQVTASAEEIDGMVHLRGEFPLVQTQFGIKPYRKAFGAVGVADELKVWGDLWLAK